jgi:DNA-binding NarL/FixJ family response regulator
MPSFTVLVVDDFANFRECVCSMLEGTTFRVVGQAADGLEAVRKARGCQPDLILLDIGLPKLNGIEAARRISVEASRSKVIFVSQNEDPDVVKSALSNGACGYLLKSAMGGELLPALASVLRGEKFLSGRLAANISA